MRNFVKKMLSVFLAAVMIFGNAGTVFAAESEEQSLEEIIRPQIEAFAKSIDQKDADGAAADALATHGMFKNGKKLVVGENHALTATLLNSELMKYVLTIVLSETFESVKKPDEIKMGYLACGYYDSAWYDYKIYRNEERIRAVWHKNYSGAYSSYDESLEWLGGTLECDIEIKLSEISADKIIYDIDVVIFDRFDFNTENESALKNLLGVIGALLFTPFNWNATADFQIEIPNDCKHSFGEWKTAAEPNCTEKGIEERSCANCGCAETRATGALGHSFGEWAVETEPSCTESGTERRDCSNCDHHETKEIAPKGHSFGEWYESKAPTYHEEGEEQRKCSSCGETESRAVATLEYLLGDLNGDEKINVLDANLVRRYAAELEELDEKRLAAADVNGDGKINVLDANLIRRFAAKLIDAFPNK